MTAPASPQEAHEGIYSLLTFGEVADALKVSYSRLKTWAKKGALPFQQDEKGEWRPVKTTDLIRFAEEKELELDLERVLERKRPKKVTF